MASFNRVDQRDRTWDNHNESSRRLPRCPVSQTAAAAAALTIDTASTLQQSQHLARLEAAGDERRNLPKRRFYNIKTRSFIIYLLKYY